MPPLPFDAPPPAAPPPLAPPPSHIDVSPVAANAANSIEIALAGSNSSKLDSNVRDEIYKTLSQMRQSDKNFDADLISVNAQLQHDGYLPNLYIVGNDQAGADPKNLIGPGAKDGFHLAATEASPTQTGGTLETTVPKHAAVSGQSQEGWHSSNPGNPVGSTGGDGNVGGSTPISSSSVESSPVNMSTMTQEQLVPQIRMALKLLNAQRAAEGLPPIPDDPQSEQAVMQIISHESGGNPNAQNNSDSNAAAGHPSKGLMQTIDGTFSAYHVQGTSNNVFDPVANIAAGVNYAVSRYHSLQEVPGVAAMANGGSYVGY